MWVGFDPRGTDVRHADAGQTSRGRRAIRWARPPFERQIASLYEAYLVVSDDRRLRGAAPKAFLAETSREGRFRKTSTHDRLHVTEADDGNSKALDFARKGSGSPRAVASTRSAPRSDLGSGCAVTRLCSRSPPAVRAGCNWPDRAPRTGVHRRNFRMANWLNRGEIWTVSGGPDYAGKPRPALIVQDDAYDATASITICPLSTQKLDAPLIRLAIVPSERNGLRVASFVMIDKVTTVSKNKINSHVGRLSDEDLLRVNRALIVFLGLAGHGSR